MIRSPASGIDFLLSLLFSETGRVQRLATPLAFLLLDLDRFARINEEYGHEIGDRVLQEFANRLRRYDLIGRSGDDEFLIALPGCNSVQALDLAARVRTILLHRPFDRIQSDQPGCKYWNRT